VGYPKGANSMAISGFYCRKAFAGTGMAISFLFGIKWTPFPAFKVPFLSFARRHIPKFKVVGVVTVTYLIRVDKMTWEQFRTQQSKTNFAIVKRF